MIDINDDEFDPDVEAEFESELLLDDDLTIIDDHAEIVIGEHLSIDELRDRELEADEYYRSLGAGWDEI